MFFIWGRKICISIPVKDGNEEGEKSASSLGWKHTLNFFWKVEGNGLVSANYSQLSQYELVTEILPFKINH